MVTVCETALVYSQKRGAPREMAVKTEVSAPREVLPRAFCSVPTMCRVLWVSWLPGPGIRAFFNMDSGLCLVLQEVARVPSHTVRLLSWDLRGRWLGKAGVQSLYGAFKSKL